MIRKSTPGGKDSSLTHRQIQAGKLASTQGLNSVWLALFWLGKQSPVETLLIPPALWAFNPSAKPP